MTGERYMVRAENRKLTNALTIVGSRPEIRNNKFALFDFQIPKKVTLSQEMIIRKSLEN